MIMLFFNLKRYSYIIFGVLIFASVPSEGLVGPKNTAVVVGTRTTLNCSSDSNSPVWIWRMPDSTVVAYSSQTRTSPCVVDTPFIGIYNVSTPSTGSSYCNLIILNATSAGAGSYSCSDGTATGASAVLLVLDSPPRCGSDAANDTAVYPDNKNVTMNCSLQFNSTSGWIPSLQWSPTSPPSSGTSYPNINTAYSSLTYPTQASTPIQSYTCRVVYNISVNVDISCSTQPVNVFWPPREVTITGAPGGYILSGSSLICSASGNPSPTYQWFNYTNNLLASVPSLAIWKEGNYTCIASNNINERLYNTSAFQNIVNVTQTTTQKPTTTQTPATTTVTTRSPVSSVSVASPYSVTEPVTGTTPPTPTPTPGPCPRDCIIIIVVVGGGGLIIIIIIIIAVCCCKRKRTCCFKPKDKKQTTSTDNLTATTADVSYTSHQNPAFDNVPPPYDNVHPPRGNYNEDVPPYAIPQRGKPDNIGSVNFSIFYYQNQSQLIVKLIQAIELVPGSRSKTAHPYACVSLLPERRDQLQSQKSQIHPNTLSPQFDEEFSFEVSARQVSEKTVEILLFDADDDERRMGQVHLPLNQVDLTEGLNSAWKGISPCEKKTQGNGGSMGTVPVNSPYSYEDVVPTYANPNKSQRVNGDPKSLYLNRNNPNYADDAVQYAQLEMDNKPRSRQPLQAVEIPKETEYEFVKRA